MRSLTLSLALALATALPATAQVQPNRHVAIDNMSWGYVQLRGGPVNSTETVDDSGPGFGFRQGLVITVLTRDGAPVTMADRQGARRAAEAICTASRRHFDPHAQGILLRRGGWTFTGACS